MGAITQENRVRFPAAFSSLREERLEGRYLVRPARTDQELEAALRLRFEVFNLELGAGLASSFRAGRDHDELDSTSTHFILVDQRHCHVIGTYRMRSYENAKTIRGFYLSRQFDLSALPRDVLAGAIEVDRLCVAKAHRRSCAQLVLLKSLGVYLVQEQKPYVFGCFSLATQDPMHAGRVFDQLSKEGHLHPHFKIKPKPGFKCLWYKTHSESPNDVLVSSWFRFCLRFGTRLCGPPAINREFRTIDFPVVLDINHFNIRRFPTLSVEDIQERPTNGWSSVDN